MPLAYPYERRARRARTAAAGLAAASVALTGAVTGTFATSAVAADSAAPTVALVGNLQSELGCVDAENKPVDWQPACPQTELTLGEDGVYTGEFTVPANAEGETYEYKVAYDDAWDVSYPANGNVPLYLAGETRIRFTYDPEAEDPKIRLTPLDLAGEYTEADEEIVAPPVRQPGSDERFYFVMADRFANGDPSNDTGGIAGGRLDHGFDPTNKGFYQGGDLRGVIENLDYIQGLGTTAIWLTPSFKNRPVQGIGESASAGYHGYWITDFTQIDPHLGTNAELEELITEAQARGIKVYFDIVTNHTADVISYEEGEYSYVEQDDEPYVDAEGTPFRIEDVAGEDPFPALTEESFPYTPFVRPEDRQVKVPAIFNDPRYYHNRGDSTWEGESVTLGDFQGLDDIMTEHPAVVDAFIDVYQDWIDLGVDGFRIDTAKHVNFEFWEDWSTEVIDHARATGKDEFFMFGEVYSSDAKILSPYVRDTDMSSVLDFGFQERAINFAKGNGAGNLQTLFANDDMFLTPHSSAYALPTFLGNHDMGRSNLFLSQTDNPLERAELANSLMYLTRGQPVVYYGDEQGFVGSGGDKDARQTMFATQVEQYAAEKLITGETAGKVDRYDTEAPLYQHIASLAALRDAHPALAQGAQVERLAQDNLYAFSRVGETTEDLSGVVHRPSKRVVDADAVPGGTTRCYSVDDVTDLDVPADAVGAVVNVAAVRPQGVGNVVVYPAGDKPTASTVNFEAGRDVANSAFVALSDDHRFCFTTAGSKARIIVDVTGFVTDSSGIELQNPQRVLDTRKKGEQIEGALERRKPYEITIAGKGGVPADATSVLLNVAVTEVTANGHLKVYPGGSAVPGTSTVNYAPGQDKANATVVELSDAGTISLFSDSVLPRSAKVVIDVAGWTTAGSDLVGVRPERLVETRPEYEQRGIEGALVPQKPYTVQVAGELGVPADAGAVVLNVTAVAPTTNGNLKVYPEGELGAPSTSRVNYIPGRAIGNLVVVDLPESGKVTFETDQYSGSTHLAVDVVGYVKGDIKVTEDVEYVVVANNGAAEATASFRTLTPRGEYEGILGASGDLVADREGDVTVTVPARSVVAFAGSRTVAAAGDFDISVSLPVAGAGLKTDALTPVQAITPDNRYLETSFAFRLVGTDEWTPLGTSDNGNDRVFHDVARTLLANGEDLPDGTLVEYRAVSVDVAGNTAAASTFASVGNAVQFVPSEDGGVPTIKTVTLPGTHGAELGCAADWDPSCVAAGLVKDANNPNLWVRTFEDVPAGTYQFKAAVNGPDEAWGYNWGLNGIFNSPSDDIAYTHPGGAITFYFLYLGGEDARVWNSSMAAPASIAGAFQDQVGCAANWDPACVATIMTLDPATGISTITLDVPAGTHEFKIVHGLRWPNGDDPSKTPGAADFGAPGGGNYSHAFPGGPVTFTWNPAAAPEARLTITPAA